MERNEPVTPDVPGYDAPRVEEVLDADDLEREAHYAGTPGSPTIG